MDSGGEKYRIDEDLAERPKRLSLDLELLYLFARMGFDDLIDALENDRPGIEMIKNILTERGLKVEDGKLMADEYSDLAIEAYDAEGLKESYARIKQAVKEVEKRGEWER